MRGPVISFVRGRNIAQLMIVALTVPGCSSRSEEVEPDKVNEVSQALAGDCGYDYGTCAAHSACQSWDRYQLGDGLGYTPQPSWTENGPSYSYSCGETWCDDPSIDPCPDAATARQNQLRDPAVIPSQPARDGLNVTLEEINTGYWETPDCQNPYSQACIRGWDYTCYLHVNNYPAPDTGVHDWCPCAAYQPVDCEPNNAVVGGTGHTCALINGGLKCWGANMNGQLGNGQNAPQSVQPVPVTYLTNGVYTVAAGGLHTCAIKQGAATCWGQNVNGQLGNAPAGDDTTVRLDSNVPVAVTGLSNAVQGISAGNAHSCAVVLGAAKCWGNNDFGPVSY